MMLVATVLLIAAGLSYLLLTLLFLLGTFRTAPTTEQEPFITVLVAARNEENTIEACLESLGEQTCPEHRFEILVIDDQSSDRTVPLVRRASRSRPNVRLLSVPDSPQRLSGKQNALALGVQQARGRIILVTDADCVVPCNWIKGMAQRFDDETGLVGAFTLFRRPEAGHSLFTRLQELDLLYLLTVASGAAGISRATSLIGNNFAFRRSAYDQVGGYERLGFSPTEDVALLNAIRRQTDWKIRLVTDPELTVASLPARSPAQFYWQRKRWALGGLDVPVFGAYVLTSAVLMRLVILLLLVLAPWDRTYLLMALLAVLLTGLSDFWLALRGCFLQLRFDLLRYFPLLVPFQFVYNLALAVPILLGRTGVRWKDRTFEAHSV